MKKKFFALMMAMVMVLSLAACSSSDEADPNSGFCTYWAPSGLRQSFAQNEQGKPAGRERLSAGFLLLFP